MANAEQPWWVESVAAVFGTGLTALMAAVAWMVKDRADVRRMLDEHEMHIKKILEIQDRWEDGYKLNNAITALRIDVVNIKERLDRWGWRKPPREGDEIWPADS